MAGFYYVALTFVFGLIALCASLILSFVMFFIAKKKFMHKGRQEWFKFFTVTVSPFIGLLWLIASLLIHVQVSNKLAHQDCGFSGDPYVTLPNGFELGSRNTYDGYIVAPGFKTDTPSTGPGYVRSIIDLQFSNDVFTGTLYDGAFVRNFTFDTRTRNSQISEPLGPMDFETAATKVAHDETSYWKLYDKYRHHWPNYLLFLLIILGEYAIGYWIWWLLQDGI